MFGATGTGDTSGYGRLVREVVDAGQLAAPVRRLLRRGRRRAWPRCSARMPSTPPIERVVVYRDQLTLEVRREQLPAVMQALRDDPGLRFELCLGVSGVHYPARQRPRAARRLPADVDHPQQADPGGDHRAGRRPAHPVAVPVYPTTDWHERETYDFFGIIFDGHPSLTRIEMPDDWVGHPQRKDYPLGGIPVEYHGAEIPPPDERRAYS